MGSVAGAGLGNREEEGGVATKTDSMMGEEDIGVSQLEAVYTYM